MDSRSPNVNYSNYASGNNMRDRNPGRDPRDQRDPRNDPRNDPRSRGGQRPAHREGSASARSPRNRSPRPGPPGGRPSNGSRRERERPNNNYNGPNGSRSNGNMNRSNGNMNYGGSNKNLNMNGSVTSTTPKPAPSAYHPPTAKGMYNSGSQGNIKGGVRENSSNSLNNSRSELNMMNSSMNLIQNAAGNSSNSDLNGHFINTANVLNSSAQYLNTNPFGGSNNVPSSAAPISTQNLGLRPLDPATNLELYSKLKSISPIKFYCSIAIAAILTILVLVLGIWVHINDGLSAKGLYDVNIGMAQGYIFYSCFMIMAIITGVIAFINKWNSLSITYFSFLFVSILYLGYFTVDLFHLNHDPNSIMETRWKDEFQDTQKYFIQTQYGCCGYLNVDDDPVVTDDCYTNDSLRRRDSSGLYSPYNESIFEKRSIAEDGGCAMEISKIINSKMKLYIIIFAVLILLNIAACVITFLNIKEYSVIMKELSNPFA